MNKHYIDDLFLLHYSDGIKDEEFSNKGNRHIKNYQASEKAQTLDLEELLEENSYSINYCCDFITKLVTMSTIISVFEKVAFKNYLSDYKVRPLFLKSLYEVITNNNEETFNNFVYTLSLKKKEKNSNPCKWPLITYLLVVFHPYDEVFIKPTTIKRILTIFDSDISYTSTPNYETYHGIRSLLLDYKKHSSIAKKVDNFTLSGILFVASQNDLIN